MTPDDELQSRPTGQEPADGSATADPAVMSVLPDGEGSAEVVGLAPEQLSAMIAGLQGELAGTAKTGNPAVDAAMERLGDLDPADLGGSADVLADVLHRLEAAMGEGTDN
jgi:hypothetical protein